MKTIPFSRRYPACVNDPACAAAVLAAGTELLGERLVGPPTPNMAGEDFCFFLHRKPGAFFFVGKAGGRRGGAGKRERERERES